MTTPKSLLISLRCAGWAVFIAYIFRTIFSSLIRMDELSQVNLSENLTAETVGISFFGTVIEAPLHISMGVLCLAAANYLIKNPKNISEVFE